MTITQIDEETVNGTFHTETQIDEYLLPSDSRMRKTDAQK